MTAMNPTSLDQETQDPWSAIAYSVFGKLPPELRLRIYSFLLEPGAIHIWRRNHHLHNTFCSSTRNESESHAPLGTQQDVIAEGRYRQEEVVTEGSCDHPTCFLTMRSPARPRISLSLFRVCRLFRTEAKSRVDRVYRTSTFHFTDIRHVEGFVDRLRPYRRSLLRYVHLTLPVAYNYHGIYGPLSHTLNRLQPNPYFSDRLDLLHRAHSRGTRYSGHLRLRIQFSQYTADPTLYWTFAPSIMRLLAQLPSYLCSTITVIVPPLPSIPISAPLIPLGAPREPATKWYMNLVPSHDPRCLAEVTACIMSARAEIREAEGQGSMHMNQWICGYHDYLRRAQCWEAGGAGVGKDVEMKFTVIFGV
ncbi:MAG: hypothetical protein LQ344_001344 [Seirophora lacunosa]|nr:MAG: hypothetical protein LQ344_001344 [Seirophora lacunosa]